MLPYRLHDLVTTKGQGPVVITEGEAKADTLWAMGFRATTNPFGAGGWTVELTAYLANEDAILWPDNDTAGRGHMEQVGRFLEGVAKSIRIVEPPEALPETGDVWDGVHGLGWNRDDIDRILAEAKPWEPTEDSVADGDGDDGAGDAKESQASRLAKMVASHAKLFHDQHRVPHAQVYVGDHHEVLRCGSLRFRHWMSHTIYTA